ncbi:MAG: right-handed parallel beta-helix repeat-containing protein [Treponemataceae bacterium]
MTSKFVKQLSIFSLLFFVTVILSTCKQYTADLKDFLSYWASQAFITDVEIKAATQKDSDGILCVGSSSDAEITLNITNPKKFAFVMPTTSETREIIRFIKLGESIAAKADLDYTLEPIGNTTLKFVLKKEFLQKAEWSSQDISPTITLYAVDGRKFENSYTLNIKVNTPPPAIHTCVVAKTKIDGVYYYVLCLQVADMDKTVSGGLLHKDLAGIEINGINYRFRVNSAQTGFEKPANPDFIEASQVEKLNTTNAEAVPTGWVLYYKTAVKVAAGSTVQDYTVTLRDDKKLVSPIFKASTNPNKPLPVVISLTTGTTAAGLDVNADNTSTTPHIIVTKGTEAARLRLTCATPDSTVYYTVTETTSGASYSPIGGNKSGTGFDLALPIAAGKTEADYTLTVRAEAAGFMTGNIRMLYYKVTNQAEEELPSSTLWKTLKDKVEDPNGPDIITINGEIKAEGGDNGGVIAVKRNITIKGKTGSASDILNANNDANTKGIFKVTGSGVRLTLQNLTLKNVKDGDAIEHTKSGTLICTGVTIANVTQSILSPYHYAINYLGTDIKITGSIIDNCYNGIYAGCGSLTGCVFENTNIKNSGNLAIGTNSGGIKFTMKNVTIDGGSAGIGLNGRAGEVIMEGGSITKVSDAAVAIGKNLNPDATPSGLPATKFIMKGNAQIGEFNAAGELSSGNEHAVIKLAAGATVTVDEDITSPIAAQITLEDAEYQQGTQVLTGSKVGTHYSKFKVTEYPADVTWAIDGSGKLFKDFKKQIITATGNSGNWKELQQAVEKAAPNGIITIDGEIKALNEVYNYGTITINKNLTIKGKTGNGSDILNANTSEASVAGVFSTEIFKVTAGGSLTLQNLTVKGGKSRGITIAGTGQVTLKAGAKITGNNGGVCISHGGGQLMMETGAEISNNAADTNGAGVFIGENGRFIMNGGTISGNKAEHTGGGVYIDNNGSFTATDAKIGGDSAAEGNTAVHGGGIVVGTNGIMTLTNCTVQNNTATKQTSTLTTIEGAGIKIESHNTTCSITGGTIQNNTIQGGAGQTAKGAGIFINYNAKLLLDGCMVTGNTITGSTGTSARGSGIYVDVNGTNNDARLIMKGSANVNTNNDVYLYNGAKIKVDDVLSENPAAKITPSHYSNTTKVLDGSAVNTEYGKFIITPEDKGGGITQNWKIDNSGTLKMN